MKRKNKGLLVVYLCFLCTTAYSQYYKGLKVSLDQRPPVQNVVIFYDKYDKGQGNTSIAHDDENIYKWSGQSPYKHESWGYFDKEGKEVPYIKRDRDLGQTFTYTQTDKKYLKAITVQLGFGTNVVRSNMYGQPLSIQIMEVTGVARVNNNGSDSTMEAFHGFPHDRNGKEILFMRDDYLEGETYQTVAIFSGGRFPSKSDFGFTKGDTIAPNDAKLKGHYLTFTLPSEPRIRLEPNKSYAFLIMIDKKGKEVGFALANEYFGSYPFGHGIRRDGNGIFPPVPADVSKNFTHSVNRKAYQAAHFPKGFKKRIAIPPSTNGYPDVDTWRDLVFYVVCE